MNDTEKKDVLVVSIGLFWFYFMPFPYSGATKSKSPFPLSKSPLLSAQTSILCALTHTVPLMSNLFAVKKNIPVFTQ